ncbi:MAG: hypothetical protein KDJ52_25730 [Anaerolineae bacterium]|nr:hypothetical protein [Anaerolineae bacterium]
MIALRSIQQDKYHLLFSRSTQTAPMLNLAKMLVTYKETLSSEQSSSYFLTLKDFLLQAPAQRMNQSIAKNQQIVAPREGAIAPVTCKFQSS